MDNSLQLGAGRLSIVIVAYKSRDEIAACLHSIPLALEEKSVEVVVVDNSMDPETAGLVRQKFPWVDYVSPQKNLGFGCANNLGFFRTKGEYVLFLNPDTICCAPALLLCLKRLQDDRSIGLISPRLTLKDGSMDLACRRSIPTLWDGFCRASGLAARFPQSRWFAGYNLTYLPENGTYPVGAINGAFMMARREVLENVGLFDENFFMYGDDLDLCIRVAKAGYRIVYDGSTQITHLKGVSVAKDYSKMSTAIFDANQAVFLKHFNPRNSRLVAWKYRGAFYLWKKVALGRAWFRRYRSVRPL